MQRVVDIIDRNAQRLCFTLIDIDLQLWAIVQTVVAYARQLWIVARQLQQFVTGSHQRIVSGTGVILQLHIETGRAPEAANGRRAAGVDTGLFDFIQRFGGAFNNGKRGAGFAVTFVPVFQAHEHACDVLTVTAGAGADGGKDGRDVVFLVFEEIIFNLFNYLQRLLLG